MADTPQEEKKQSRSMTDTDYSSGETDCGFTDASYIPRDEAPRLPHIYRYTPPVTREERDCERKPITVSIRTMLILCAMCVLGGVAAGLAAGERSMAHPEEVSVESITTPAPTALTHAIEPTSSPETKPALSSSEIYEKVSGSVIGIADEETEKNALGAESRRAVKGTGFILTEDGYIVVSYETVRDAVENGREIHVLLGNGRSMPAELVGAETEQNDIAVLKIDEKGLPAVQCGDLREEEIGNAVFVIGNPLGELSGTMRQGMISATEHTVALKSGDGIRNARLYQIDLAASLGEGAVVFSDRGKLLGIMTETISGNEIKGYGFAVSVNDTVSVARHIIEQGDVPGTPYMGIVVQTVSRAVAEYYNQFEEDSMVIGAQVYSMEEGCCAECAGICRGDIITKIEDTAVCSAAELVAAVNEFRAGDEAELTLFRDGEYLIVSVIFDEKSGE